MRGRPNLEDPCRQPSFCWSARRCVVFGLLALWILTPAVRAQTNLPEPSAVYEVMRRANDYWIANYGLGSATWDNSAYYTGNQRAFRLLSEPAYLQRALAWANANGWQIGPEGPQGPYDWHADAHCCGQTYLDLYRLDPQPERIASIQQTMEAMVNSDFSDDDWWWIDAFYMAAPTLARLGNITGDTNYYQKLLRMYDYMKNTRGLFDPAAGLWYRDESYIYPAAQTSGGNKVFWSRGNGWVIAGLARVLEQMPVTAPERLEMVSMFQTMAAALRDLQAVHGTDGMWRSSLYEPTDYGGTPETSGTAFFTFAMAWGVRNGLLDPADYTNTIARAWHGLTNISLFPDGRVGYVQAVGAAPNYVNPYDTANYGVGAFLLACTEIALLNTNSPSVSAWAGPDEAIYDSGQDGREQVALDATATEVYRGTATSFTWWTNGSPIATGITAQAWLPLGTNVVTLEVAHSDGMTYTDQVQKTVVSLPDVIADAGPDEILYDTDRNGQETVTLDASGTQVNFGTVTSYNWGLGDICLGSGTNVPITLPTGRHVITLRAISSEGPEYTDEVVKFIAIKIEPADVVASAEPETNHPAWKTVDDSLDPESRWSAQGFGQYLRFDMRRTNRVSAVHVAFFAGNVRTNYLSVETSNDGIVWSTAVSFTNSSAVTLDRERFVFPNPTDARYIQVTGYGNSVSTWNSWTEVTIEAAPGMVDADTDGLPDLWEQVELGDTSGNAGTFSDADPLSDGEEYIAGTSPTDDQDVPELQLVPLGDGSLRLSFLARAALGVGYTGLERRYALEQTSDPHTGSWTVVSGWEAVRGDNCLKTPAILPGTGPSYYRTRIWLQSATPEN